MHKTTIKTWQASFTTGLFRGYDKTDVITEVEFKKALVLGQKEIFRKYTLLLSAKIVRCSIFADGQDEASMELQFINYPKFPADEKELKMAITELAVFMMKMLSQNRTVIIFPDDTIMLEANQEALDPGIKLC
jgi:hypothetical protein